MQYIKGIGVVVKDNLIALVAFDRESDYPFWVWKETQQIIDFRKYYIIYAIKNCYVNILKSSVQLISYW